MPQTAGALPLSTESAYKAAMPIRLLPENMVNQIAAGEVVERPASVVKELAENALDAGAQTIEIATSGGGLSLIRVIDDGAGIAEEELALAVSRHCTSKLGHSIHDIATLGFRGEALPSIGSVARLLVRSRVSGRDGAEILVDGGRVTGPRPAAANQGTLAEVRDLFFATPARLKFMKGERAEASAITDIVRRLACGYPGRRFVLSGTDRQTLEFAARPDTQDGRLQRAADVLGAEFQANCVFVSAEREGVRLDGFTSLAAFSRGNALSQYLHVNGRPVRDKALLGAIRGAYADRLASGRHALCALYIELDPALVDVNVHPAKADVRFRDPGLVRGLLVGAIRQALDAAQVRPSTAAASSMAQAFHAPMGSAARQFTRDWGTFNTASPKGFAETAQAAFGHAPSARADVTEPEMAGRLGAARAQIHENYIIAQTPDSLVIVDQHAAHERLVYEALKSALDSRPVPSQILLLPEIIDLSEDDADRLAAHAESLARFGLALERFGPGAVCVRETPGLLGETDVQKLVRDLADELAEAGTADGLRGRLDRIASSMACHGSVRSGRRMRPEEMNALLRKMEATPGSETCNHGRPTFIELKLADIERLFGRT